MESWTGLVDRKGLAEGTPKFDTGKMKVDAGNILSKKLKIYTWRNDR